MASSCYGAACLTRETTPKRAIWRNFVGTSASWWIWGECPARPFRRTKRTFIQLFMSRPRRADSRTGVRCVLPARFAARGDSA